MIGADKQHNKKINLDPNFAGAPFAPVIYTLECGQVYAWLLLDLQATPEADKSARVTLGTLLTKLNNSLKVNEIV